MRSREARASPLPPGFQFESLREPVGATWFSDIQSGYDEAWYIEKMLASAKSRDDLFFFWVMFLSPS